MKFIDVELDVARRRITLPGGKAISFDWGSFAQEYKPPAEPAEGVPWTVLYEQFIPKEMYVTFWEMVTIAASWRTGPVYARLKNEVRGYIGDGQGFGGATQVAVPRWAKAWLWLKMVVTRRSAIVYGKPR